MRKFLLYSSALVLGLSGAAEAACIQTPTCSSLGYTSSSSCTGGVKCPFGNAWNCSVNEIKTELTNKITELETQITELKKEMATSNCFVGDILYSDISCFPSIVVSKKPIGVVFDRENRLAIALNAESKAWSDEEFDVIKLPNYGFSSDATGDMQGKKNTQIVLEYCKTNGKSCPAFEYVNSYKTEGTQAGDWYLPAMGELEAMYENKDVLNTTLDKIGGTKLPTDYHWSSSEVSYYYAWIQNFYTAGIYDNHSKRLSRSVRPVLAF